MAVRIVYIEEPSRKLTKKIGSISPSLKLYGSTVLQQMTNHIKKI